jgi:hypothetical protein
LVVSSNRKSAVSVASTARKAVNVAQAFFSAYNAHEVDKMLAMCKEGA